MIKTVWLPAAREDLVLIHEYIEADSPIHAAVVLMKIVASVELLANSPGMGRPGRVKRTRELVLPDIPYTIAYRVKGLALEVLRVFHQSRIWPNAFS